MSAATGRIAAVDAFRGITIAAMILVNNPGSWSHVYAPMLHATWHGWTPTDLIFPFFIFIVGIAAAYAIPRQQAKGMSAADVLLKALVRSLKLIGLGLFLALFYYNFSDPDYSWWQSQLLEIRYPGVLQRIGIVFIITAILMVSFHRRGLIAWAIGLTAGYLVLMTAVPYPTGNPQFQGNWEFGNSFAAWLDHALLGPAHVYYGKASPFAFDPEGLLSTLPAVVSCLTGVFTGMLLKSTLSLPEKVRWMVIYGVAGVIAGYVLNLWVPINKALWTPSYVLLTSGLALVILALLVWLMDISGRSGWATPFIICGSNSIAFYMLAGILARLLMMVPLGDTSLQGWIYRDLLVPIAGPLNGSLFYAILFLLVCFLPIWVMYKKGIFWKV